MPWSISKREGQYCVVKEGDDSPVPGGCHNSRADAIKHQRALYANESRVAALYEQLDAVEEEAVIEQAAAQEIKVILAERDGGALTAAMIQALDVISQRLEAGERTTEAMLAALTAATSAAPPTIVVEPTPIHVDAPNVTVEAPSVTVEPPAVTVQAPQVNVYPEIVLPADRREVVFERDAAGRITSAVVEDG